MKFMILVKADKNSEAGRTRSFSRRWESITKS